jgi:hypothetical protein
MEGSIDVAQREVDSERKARRDGERKIEAGERKIEALEAEVKMLRGGSKIT